MVQGQNRSLRLLSPLFGSVSNDEVTNSNRPSQATSPQFDGVGSSNNGYYGSYAPNRPYRTWGYPGLFSILSNYGFYGPFGGYNNYPYYGNYGGYGQVANGQRPYLSSNNYVNTPSASGASVPSNIGPTEAAQLGQALGSLATGASVPSNISPAAAAQLGQALGMLIRPLFSNGAG